MRVDIFPPDVLPFPIEASAEPSFNPKQLIFEPVTCPDAGEALFDNVIFSTKFPHPFASDALIKYDPPHRSLRIESVYPFVHEYIYG